jgi:hypothetical protein
MRNHYYARFVRMGQVDVALHDLTYPNELPLVVWEPKPVGPEREFDQVAMQVGGQPPPGEDIWTKVKCYPSQSMIWLSCDREGFGRALTVAARHGVGLKKSAERHIDYGEFSYWMVFCKVTPSPDSGAPAKP